MPLAWGIIGPGSIADEIAPFVFGPPGTPNVLRAVASRSPGRSQAFAEKHAYGGQVKAYGSYAELIADEEVQAVYVATPLRGRKELCLACAAAGKHVIAEKPLFATAKDVEEVIAGFRSRNLAFLDATHWVHHPRTALLRARLQDPSFGPVSDVAADFRIALPVREGQVRFDAEAEPLGVLGDLGWYPIRVILFAFGNLVPEKVIAVATPITESNPALASISGIISFPALRAPDGTLTARTARFSASFTSTFVQNCTILSDRAILELDDFVHPWPYITRRGTSLNRAFPTAFRHAKRFAAARETVALPEKDAAVVGSDALFRKFASLVERGVTADAETEEYLRADVLTHAVFEACLESARKGGAAVSLRDATKASL
ncbi:hypothetical protein DFJ74DRAFT_691165 [Hyaloraphidium curvatum]|nr:hypothetical protein DFJ74DRAFT_691165 [Hyaloraphidium curvatum]